MSEDALTREAQQRWGDTDAWRESQKRMADYTSADKATAQAEMSAILDRFAVLAGHNPADGEVQALVGEWQAHISRRYYDCAPEILAGLGQMYTADQRFQQTLDAHGPGTAELMHRAIEIYCNKADG